MKKLLSLLVITVMIIAESFAMLVALMPNTYAETETQTTVTRGEWIKELVATFEMSVDEDNYPDNYFSDINKDSKYYYDIMVATEFGVIDIEAGEEVKPNDVTTREFAAHTLNFCLGFELEESSYTYKDNCTYKDDVQIALNRGWFSLSNGNALPNIAITTEEKEIMITDAKSVIESTKIDSSFNNKYKFAEGVIEVTEYAKIDENNIVTIEGLTKQISVGKTIVVYSEGFPVVYIAKKVTKNGTKTIIETSEGDKDAAILSVQQQGDTDISVSEFDAAEGVIAEYVETEQQARTLSLAKGVSITKNSIYAEKTIKLSNGIKTKVTLNLSDLKIQSKIDTIGGNYYISVSGKSTLTGTVSADVIAEALGSSTIEFGKIRVFGVGEISVAVELELNGKVTVSYVGKFEAGLQYSRSKGFRLVKTFKKTKFSSVIEATAKIGIKVQCGVDIIAAKASIYATTGIKAKYVSETYNDGKRPAICTQISGWLYATVGASATLGIKPLQKSFQKSIDIYSFSNSPVRLSYHYEDRVKVQSCTRGKDYKYLTAEDSRYGICSYGDASSTGYDSNGKEIIIYTYTLNDSGDAIITGYKGNSSILAIPSTIDGYKVVEIGSSAFANNASIVYVTIPDTITKINSKAFRNCTNITSVIFEEGVLTTIGSYAFDGCSSIISIEIPDTVTLIDYGSFRECTNLRRLYLPKNIQTGGYATEKAYPGPFYGCLNLKNVTFGEGTTIINTGIFQYTGIEEITIPENVTEIAYKAFVDCIKLKNINWNKKLTKIGAKAFGGCVLLEEAILPDTLRVVGTGAFQNNSSLKKVYLPKNTVAGDYVLENSQYPAPFNNCLNIETIEFATGIKRIPKGMFGYTGIKNITIPNTVTTIEDKAFYSCKYLETVTIPSSVKKIGSRVFNNSGIKELIIPNTVESIGTYLVAGDKALTKITLPNTLTSIPDGTCLQCTNLKEITLPEKVTEINYEAFKECESLEKINWSKSIKYIKSYTFYGCKSLKELNIPNTVEEIWKYAFYNNDGLTKVTIPNSVTFLSNYVFYDCDNLQNISLGNGITEIKESTFEHCDSLKEIVLPNKVKSIEKNAFKDCVNLVRVTIPKSTTTISESAFSYPDLITIVGVKGSYAETFAEENYFTYEELKEKHNYTKKVTAPTCTKKGYTTYTCTDCGYSYKDNYTNPVGHRIVNDTLIAATTSKNGKEKGTHCSVCNKILSGNNSIAKINRVSLSATSYIYDRKAKKPSVTVKDRKENKIDSKYYTVKYNNNTKIGKASAKVIFKGKYSGTKTVYFNIVPKKVTGLKAKKQTTTSITFNWSKVTEASGYELYKYNSSKKKWEKIKTTSKTSYTVKNLKVGTTYRFKVRAYKKVNNETYCSSYSSVLTTTTKTSTPKILRVTSKSKKATINWKKVSGAKGYEIWMATSKKGKYSKIKTVTKGNTVKYTKSSLKKNKTYYFKIRTYRTVDGKKVYSSYSTVKSIKVK